jgi:hypothetical protein
VLAGILTGRTILGVTIDEPSGGSTDMVPKTGCGYGIAASYGVAWFLLISGTRVALRIVRTPGKVEDAGVLADMLFVWRWVWCLLWLAGTIAALAFGGRILIRG